MVHERRAQDRTPPLPTSRAERRERIVRTALDLLAESEYEAIQMRDVADAANVALATLYRYFPSKEQLFAAVQLEWVERLQRRVAQRPPQGNTNLERLMELIHKSIQAFKKKPQFYRVLLVLEATKDPVARELYDVMSRATTATYLEAFVDVDPETAGQLLTAATDVLGAEMRQWALGKHSIEAAEQHIEASLRLLFTYRDPAAASKPAPRSSLRIAGS